MTEGHAPAHSGGLRPNRAGSAMRDEHERSRLRTEAELRALGPPPAIVRGHFVAIAAETHAAPMTSMVLGRVVKKEDTGRILAFFNQREFARAEQVAGRLGE